MKHVIEEKLRALGGIVPIGARAPMDELEIQSIESDIQSLLPGDYRQFLTEYGAGAFGELVEFQPIESLPMPISDTGKGVLSDFYGAQRSPNSLGRYIATYKGRMPDTLVPIANDGGGNQICIGIGGTERGKVYFWNHHDEWDDVDYMERHGTPMPEALKFQNVFLIADSFEDFIRRVERSGSV